MVSALFGGLFWGACTSHGVGIADGAVDAPPPGASTSTVSKTDHTATTSTGVMTGTATATVSAKVTATARTEETDVGWTPATATSTTSGEVPLTNPWTGYATSVKTGPAAITVTDKSTWTNTGSNTTSPSTGPKTGTATKTTTFICHVPGATDASTGITITTGSRTSLATNTATMACASWNTIKVSRASALGFCPTANSAASVAINRSQDGSLILTGKAFRTIAESATGCADNLMESYAGVCLKGQPFDDVKLTPSERDRLMNLVNAMPAGKCTFSGSCDPCILTSLSIDDESDTDWGFCCQEPIGPGSHLAGERAIVAYIDSLLPAHPATGVDASVGLDAQAPDTARDSRVFPAERSIGPCDLYADGKTPCVAAYSTIRALSKSYNGPLFQVRAGSSTYNNTMSGGTTKDIMPGPDGFVDVSAVDEACGKGTCTVSVLYDHSGNGNDLVRATKGTTAGGASGAVDDYESIATKGRVMAGGHQVYSLYMNQREGYRTAVGVVGKNMPTGTEAQGIYMLADGTRKATGCCWNFGNVTTKPATEWAFVDALSLGSGVFSLQGAGTGAGSGPWFRADFGEIWAGGDDRGGYGSPRAPNFIGVDPIPLNNVKNPSLDRTRFALGFLKASTSEYAIRVADLLSAKADDLVTAWKGGMPEKVGHKGGIVLGVDAENSNASWGTFYEGAIVAGYPSDAVELSVMNNTKAMGYATVP